MKIYTKTGDQGETGLFGGERVKKDDSRVAAYGTVDELNSVIGMAAASASGVMKTVDLNTPLAKIQSELFDLGAELATPTKRQEALTTKLTPDSVEALESLIDTYEKDLPALQTFILPGGSMTAAHLHHARTVCRRAEREIVSLARDVAVRPLLTIYINRLSDALFVMARRANSDLGVKDVPWLGRDARSH